MISEAIILAGGLGTRLRSAVPDMPKCMAPVAGRPFIDFVINYFLSEGISRFVFALGYKHEIIETHLQKNFPHLYYTSVIEEDPLGTGGAIKLALGATTTEDVLILNGDTLFKVDLSVLSDFHSSRNASCTLSLKPMEKFDRYGVVELGEENRIHTFHEKKYYHEGLINGGVYVLNSSAFNQLNFPAKFSFEKDYLEKYYSTKLMYGIIQSRYFIDIGIPEDYARAQLELSTEQV